MPLALLPPLTPSTDQVTAWFEEFCTLAENCCVPPAGTLAEAGEMLTLIAEDPVFPPLEVLDECEPAQPIKARIMAKTKLHSEQKRDMFIQFSLPTALPLWVD